MAFLLSFQNQEFEQERRHKPQEQNQEQEDEDDAETEKNHDVPEEYVGRSELMSREDLQGLLSPREVLIPQQIGSRGDRVGTPTTDRRRVDVVAEAPTHGREVGTRRRHGYGEC